MTTADVDFLGSRERAKEVAREIRARVAVPSIADASPNTAILDLGSGNREDERVDFLDYVVGPGDRLAGAAIALDVPLSGEADGEHVLIRIIHPLHCLESKLENRRSLLRDGLGAQAQLEATTPILREFISEMLDQRDGNDRSPAAKMAFNTLDRLGAYLERDLTGRHADRYMTRDPLNILKQFATDMRIPAKFREHNLANATTRIEKMRARRK